MGKLTSLFMGDLKGSTRDPMLFITAFAPVLLTLFLKIGLPFADLFAKQEFGIDLMVHYPLIISILVLTTPMMIGTFAGFIILDERDENILQALSITPLSKISYLAYRLTSPVVVSFIFTLVALGFLDSTILGRSFLWIIVAIASLGAPMMALFLAAFASNKVEGIAYSKGMGIFFLAPLVGYFIGGWINVITGIFPPFWIINSLVKSMEGSSIILYLIAGFGIHVLYIVILFKRFSKRVY